tara:strand:- start:387 stop:542 length:156 start_codon:yes stop_codon:yes gene_type:complete
VASWEKIAARAERNNEELKLAIQVCLDVISYNDRDEDEKITEIEAILKKTI